MNTVVDAVCMLVGVAMVAALYLSCGGGSPFPSGKPATKVWVSLGAGPAVQCPTVTGDLAHDAAAVEEAVAAMGCVAPRGHYHYTDAESRCVWELFNDRTFALVYNKGKLKTVRVVEGKTSEKPITVGEAVDFGLVLGLATHARPLPR